MKSKSSPKHRVVVACEGSFWTLLVDGSPLIRTLDPKGAREMAKHLQRAFAAEAVGNN